MAAMQPALLPGFVQESIEVVAGPGPAHAGTSRHCPKSFCADLYVVGFLIYIHSKVCRVALVQQGTPMLKSMYV